MKSDVSKLKADFIEEVFFSNAFSAAVQHSRTYSVVDVPNDNDKKKIRETIKVLLRDIRTSPQYSTGGVEQEEHVRTIEKFASDVTDAHRKHLYDNKFRIGTAQKLLNVYLKLYWCAEQIAEPPHCPIDRIIIGALDSEHHEVNWTTLDDLVGYQKLIEAAKSKAGAGDEKLSLAVWELKSYSEITKRT